MNYQIQSILKCVSKSIFWILIYIVLLYFLYSNLDLSLSVSRQDMTSLLAVPNEKSFWTSINLLFFLYQIFIILFSVHTYFTFEENNSLEYTLCRISKKKLFQYKIVFSFLLVLLYRLFHFIIIYQLFSNYVSFMISDFIFNIVEFLIIWFIYLLFYLLFMHIKNK